MRWILSVGTLLALAGAGVSAMSVVGCSTDSSSGNADATGAAGGQAGDGGTTSSQSGAGNTSGAGTAGSATAGEGGTAGAEGGADTSGAGTAGSPTAGASGSDVVNTAGTAGDVTAGAPGTAGSTVAGPTQLTGTAIIHHQAQPLMGMNCLGCHDGSDTSIPTFLMGGQVVTSDGAPAEGAVVTAITADVELNAFVGSNGLFRVEASDSVQFDWSTATIMVTMGDNTVSMQGQAEGGCNSCHSGEEYRPMQASAFLPTLVAP